MATNPITQILFLTLFLACTQRANESPVFTNPDASPSRYTFLSLGDSYTIGESVSESDRWSVQLASLLRKNDLDVADPTIIARTGWTTAELQDAIKASANHKTYDLVSLLIGVNNQYRGQSKERYQTEFRQLLQTAIHFAGGHPGRVVVLSIPDWGRSPYARGRNQQQIADEIDAFNAIAERACQTAGVAYVNITPITRQAAGDDSQFASDGLHYSGKQMRQWAQTALPTVNALLNR